MGPKGQADGPKEVSSDLLWPRHGPNLISSVTVGEDEGMRKIDGFADKFHPRLVKVTQNDAKLIPLTKMSMEINVHLSIAFVKLKAEYMYETTTSSKGGEDAGFVFELPKSHTTTVTHCLAMLEKGAVFEAVVVDHTAALANYKDNEGKGMARAMHLYREKSGFDPSSYNPELFSFPFHGGKTSEKIFVEIDFMESLKFDNGKYVLSLPMALAAGSLPSGKSIGDVLDLTVNLDVPGFLIREGTSEDQVLLDVSNNSENSGGGEPQDDKDGEKKEKENWFTFQNFPLTKRKQEKGVDGVERITFDLNKSSPITSGPLSFSYVAWTDKIQCQVMYQKSVTKGLDKDKNIVTTNGGVASCFISPPNPESLTRYPRDVVFILDRSGSMGFSKVFSDAQKALITALKQLQPEDRFSICCFDDRQIWFGGACPTPSDESVEQLMGEMGLEMEAASNPSSATENGKVKSETVSYDPSQPFPNNGNGMAPNQQPEMERCRQVCVKAKPEHVERAIEWVQTVTPGGLTDILTPLKQAFFGMFSSSQEEEKNRLRSIFVITDGAVENEREICKFADRIAPKVRLFSFGLGFDCNAYFLRKLSSVGRGYSDVCFIRDTLTQQMVDMFSHARHAVLKDIEVKFVSSTNEGTKTNEQRKAEEEKFLATVASCPMHIPDLYSHAPVIASFRHTGVLPPQFRMQITGHLSDGTLFSTIKDIETTNAIPLQKVFAQQSIEDLISTAWLLDMEEEGDKLKKQAIDMAVSESIPTSYTQLVAVEMSRDEFEKIKADIPNEKERRLKFDIRKHKKTLILGGSIAGVAAFGCVAATMAGALASSAQADALGAVGDAGGDCCGDCDCDGDCIEMCFCCA